MEVGQAVGVLANAGVAGVVLIWFMVRLEKRLESLTQAVSDLQKAIMVLVDRTDRGGVRDFFDATPDTVPNPAPASAE